MCMEKEGEIERTSKNLYCYKVMHFRKVFGESKYVLRRTHYQTGLPVKGGLERAIGFPVNNRDRRSGGGFYAYLSMRAAKTQVELSRTAFLGYCVVVLKCLVPKGTRIIRGMQVVHSYPRKSVKAIRAEYMIHGVAA